MSVAEGRRQTPGKLTLRIQPVAWNINAASVTLAAFSPDGRFVLNVGATPGILESATGRELVRFDDPGEPVRSEFVYGRAILGVFSPDGRYAATPRVARAGSSPNGVTIWDTATGRAVQTLVTGDLRAMAFSPDATRLVTGGLQGGRVWDVQTGRQLRTLTLQPTPPTSAAIEQLMRSGRMTQEEAAKAEASRPASFHTIHVTSDGRRALVSVYGGTIRLVDLESGKELQRFSDEGPMIAIALSADDEWMIAGPRPLRLWSLSLGRSVRTLDDVNGDQISFSQDSRLILRFAPGSAARAIDVKTGAPADAANLRAAYLATTGLGPAQASLDGRRWLKDVMPSGERAATTGGGDGAITTLAPVSFSPDGRWLTTGGSDGLGARVWDLRTGQPASTIPGGARIGTPVSGVLAINGDRLIWTESTGVTSFELASGQPFGARNRPRVLAVSADGRVAARSVSPAGAIRVTDFDSSLPVGPDVTPAGPVSASLSKDGTRLLTAGRTGTLQVWDTTSGQLVSSRTLTPRSPEPLATLTLDGDHVVAALPDSLVVFDARTGADVSRLTTGRPFQSFHASPDARVVAVIEAAHVAVYDMASGRSIGRYPVQASARSGGGAVSFSSTGRHLVVTSPDGSAVVVDLETGASVCTILQTDSRWVVVSADGRFDTNRLDEGLPLHWVDTSTSTTLPVDVFTRQYYTPRLLASILAGDPLDSVPDISSLNRARPVVSIVAVDERSEDPARVDVTVNVEETRAEGRRSGAMDLRLFRNGQLVRFRGGPIALNTAGRATVRFEGVPITPGRQYTFEAYAFNDDRVKSQTAAMSYTGTSLQTLMARGTYDPFGRGRTAHVLAIGVNDVPARKDLTLQFAANDARGISGIASELLAAWASGAPVQSRMLLSDGAEHGATKAQIHEVIRSIAETARPDDLVLISFSGHGATDDKGEFWLFPSDVGGVEDGFPTGGISSSELADWIGSIDVAHLVLLVDACQAGASIDRAGFRPGPLGDRGLGQLAYDKKMLVLAATQASDLAIEHGDLAKGLMTYALVDDGWNRRAADWRPRDSRIQLGEWLAYAVHRVPSLLADVEAGRVRGVVPSRRRSAQTPMLFDFRMLADQDILLHQGR